MQSNHREGGQRATHVRDLELGLEVARGAVHEAELDRELTLGGARRGQPRHHEDARAPRDECVFHFEQPLAHMTIVGQAGAAHPAGVSFLVAGRLPRSWIDGTGLSEPVVQAWAYEPKTYVFRQSLRTNFEAPFIYLLIGGARALLVDTGTGDADLRAAVEAALAGSDVELLVAHTHGHADHVGGDAQLAARPRTRLIDVGASPVVDLGGRAVDVIAIPGHEASHVAFYDRMTGLLLTGDSLYPGRIYVRDLAAFRGSVSRLIAFVEAGHPVSHILGSHIELAADGPVLADGALGHPDEHALALGVEELRDLRATLEAMGGAVVRTARPHFVVVPA